MTPTPRLSSQLGAPVTASRAWPGGPTFACHRVVPRALPLLLLLALGCDRGREGAPPPPLEPPGGGGRYTNDAGVARTLFRTLGVLTYGDSRTVALPPADALDGYAFAAEPDATVVVELEPDGPGRAGLSIYGPRDAAGLWGDALARTEGQGPLSVQLSVPRTGFYFVLLRNLDTRRPSVTVTLRCEGACPAPACADVAACDLVCANGFERDIDDCRTCACAIEDCTETGCDDGQVCEDGVCAQPCAVCPARLEPVCGVGGRTHPNRCLAACRGVEVARAGPCLEPPRCGPDVPCSDGLACNAGHCEPPACSCPPDRAPVCSEDGRTFANACVAECLAVEVDYAGVCVPDRCGEDADCRGGARCRPAPDAAVPGNGRRCAAYAAGTTCIKQCVRAPMTCDGDGGCPEGEVCALSEGGAGVCVMGCAVGGEPCPPGLVCVAGAEDADAGLCLPRCDPTGRCPRGLQCRPDDAGERTCQPCLCPDDPGATPVCGDGVTYPDACHARCAGAMQMERGPCPAMPEACDACPREPHLVCAPDGRLYSSACEARCAGNEMGGPLDRCLGERVPLACERPEDCEVTACDGRLCAAAPTEACPALSPEATCHAELGVCGCVDGMCAFAQTRESRACVERVRGG